MEEVYNVEPEERDTIGTNPSTRLFIVWWCWKLLHRLRWEKKQKTCLLLTGIQL